MAVERPTVLVDMDGVLADFDTELETRIRELIPGFGVTDRSKGYYVLDRLTNKEEIAAHDIAVAQEGLFRGLLPIERSIEGWHEMVELGYHPQICTAPLALNLFCQAEKLAWVDEYLGPKVADEMIMSPDKWRYPGITLIDDNPAIKPGGNVPSWTQTIFTQGYNKHIETKYRINGWIDPNLPNILARCAERAKFLGV
ncbi:MAG: hypothetical protein ABI397_01075 [Candidatus Saccharimonas sp.]